MFGGSKTTDYCGNVIYENGLLKRVLAYKYNGKELDTERGLNLYDSSATSYRDWETDRKSVV